MNPKFLSSMLIMTGWILGSFLPRCSSVELTKVPKKPLPSQTPQLTELPLELSSKKGPRRPFDATTPSTLSGPGPEIIIVEIDQSALRTTAEEDAAVKQQLGDRFAFIGMEEVPADQCLVTMPSDDPPAPRATVRAISPETPLYRLTYYSYTHNLAVHVCLKDRQVFSVQADPREGYQPEEGEEDADWESKPFTWMGWDLQLEMKDAAGLGLRNVSYQGMQVLGKASLPVIRVKYVRGVVGLVSV